MAAKANNRLILLVVLLVALSWSMTRPASQLGGAEELVTTSPPAQNVVFQAPNANQYVYESSNSYGELEKGLFSMSPIVNSTNTDVNAVNNRLFGVDQLVFHMFDKNDKSINSIAQTIINNTGTFEAKCFNKSTGAIIDAGVFAGNITSGLMVSDRVTFTVKITRSNYDLFATCETDQGLVFEFTSNKPSVPVVQSATTSSPPSSDNKPGLPNWAWMLIALGIGIVVFGGLALLLGNSNLAYEMPYARYETI